MLGILAAFVLGSCVSAPDPDDMRYRNSIEYTDFVSDQKELLLREVAPNGDQLFMSYTYLRSHSEPTGSRSAEPVTIVLVHGVPSSSWMYRYVLDHLIRNPSVDGPIEVYAFDNLGYGTSTKPDLDPATLELFYTPAAQANRLLDALTQLNMQSAVFVVHDVGGPIVWELLEREPSRASGLVVLNTIGAPGGFSPPPSMDTELVQAVMRATAFRTDESIRSLVCRMVAEPERIDTPVQLEGYYHPFRDGAGVPYYWFLSTLDVVREAEKRYRTVIGGLNVPAAILWGEQDEDLLSAPSVPWFSSVLRIPPGRQVIVPGAKHLVAEEVPAQVADLILTIVEEVGKRLGVGVPTS